MHTCTPPPDRHRHRNQHEHAHTTYSWVSNTLWEISYICVEENTYGGWVNREKLFLVAGWWAWFHDSHLGGHKAQRLCSETTRFMRGRAGLMAASSWQSSDSRNQKETQRAMTYSSDSRKEGPKAQENNDISLQLFVGLFVSFKSCYHQTSQFPRSFTLMC